MARQILIFCTLVLGSGSAWATSDLCPVPPPEAQEEVVYFAESELTADTAKSAISELERYRSEANLGGGQREHIIGGNLRLIEGYLLKYRAESFPSQDSLARFCTWLQTEGHWPE